MAVIYTASPTASGYSTALAYPPDTNTYFVAYPFTTTGSGNLTSIQAWLAANTTPNFNVACQILSDSSNNPGTSLETSSTTIGYSGIVTASSAGYASASFTESTFNFAGTTALASSTQYWVVFMWATSSPSGGDDYLLGQSSSSTTNTWRGKALNNWTEPNTQTSLAITVNASSTAPKSGFLQFM